MSRTFYWALVTRFLQGIFTGTAIVSIVIITHQTNDTNIALAFSILFGAYSLSIIAGPSFAGFLVFPAEQHPKSFKKDGFFGDEYFYLKTPTISLWMASSIFSDLKYLPSCKQKQNVRPVDVVYNENSYLLSGNEYLNISYEENLVKDSISPEMETHSR
ncbi:uncharacterized protein LOC136079289 [Hydra vulgaris]|uniref:Uncharacterized protein LOC136079289 n=1 Tax=Hydra vulgaris TaxID=6087 RepID=A0ABM4BPP9_HYDVU